MDWEPCQCALLTSRAQELKQNHPIISSHHILDGLLARDRQWTESSLRLALDADKSFFVLNKYTALGSTKKQGSGVPLLGPKIGCVTLGMSHPAS
jgi:hypothetical protein